MRLSLIVVVALGSACAAPLASMKPNLAEGQDVIYDNGTPIVLSRGERTEVLVSPVTSSTGRYEVGARVSFVVQVRNRSGSRIEVSEENFSLVASGIRARTVSAIEMEDEIRSNAQWARAANAVAAIGRTFGAANAGRSTAIVRSDMGATARVEAYDHGEAARARSGAVAETLRTAEAINANEDLAVASLSRMLQRNTVHAGAVVGGFVVMSVPRNTACTRSESRASKDGTATVNINIPCVFTFTADLAGDTHSLTFQEQFYRAAEPAAPNEPPRAGPVADAWRR